MGAAAIKARFGAKNVIQSLVFERTMLFPQHKVTEMRTQATENENGNKESHRREEIIEPIEEAEEARDRTSRHTMVP